ncbi:DUF6427 family protein [uncultured Lacinutrix sp.]|uniref:DUF6427 family protein n=1 Tax=uncultured Lacinutrix sp. TaxID=574032 RepID=UPI002617F47A|nr:DUF6427 family protein [uncultured Lacinutrix sp.]
MITSIFSKSKPINFSIVFIISVLTLFIAIYKFNKVELLTRDYVFIGLSYVCCLFSILLLDFIVNKNSLSQTAFYEVILFSFFLLTTPQVFLNYRIVLSNFLILLALRRLISLGTQKDTNKKLFDAGFLIGLASIFHFWAILFFPIAFIALLFYAESEMKKWIIPMLGLIAIIIVSIAYSLIVNDSFFYALHIDPSFSIDLSAYNSIQFIVAITMFLSFGLWSSVSYLRDIKKKKKTFRPSYKIIFIIFIVAGIIMIISPNKNGSEFLFLFSPLAIIISNYIETIEEKWFKELFFILLIVIPFVLLLL